MTVTYEQFSISQLVEVGFSTSINNVRSMVTWAVSENANGNGAHWNIWDTEEVMPGDSDFNTVGVKNYPDEQTGLLAFKRTLFNGYYPLIINCLARSAAPAETLNAVYNSPWGSKPTMTLFDMVVNNWPRYGGLIVGGSYGVNPDPPIPVPSLPVNEDTNMVDFIVDGTQRHVIVFNPGTSMVTHWWQDTVGTEAGKWFQEVLGKAS
jgi:hypothetical protein